MITSTAVILAGGLGTRLRSLISDVPKPMAPIHGIPFLVHLLNYWVGQGIQNFVLATGYKHSDIFNYFGHSFEGVPISYSRETRVLGTGGALLYAREQIFEDFIFLNGDTYFEIDLRELSKFAEKKSASVVVSLIRRNEPSRYMRLSPDADGRLTNEGHPTHQDNCYSNGGVYLISRQLLNEKCSANQTPCSFEQDLLPYWINSTHGVYGAVFDGTFIDIGVPGDYLRASTVIPKI